MAKEPSGNKMSSSGDDLERANYNELEEGRRGEEPPEEASRLVEAPGQETAAQATITKRQVPAGGGPAFSDQFRDQVRPATKLPSPALLQAADNNNNPPQTERQPCVLPIARACPVDEDEGNPVSVFTIERYKVYSALVALLIAVVAFLAGYCGAGMCSSKSSSDSASTSTSTQEQQPPNTAVSNDSTPTPTAPPPTGSVSEEPTAAPTAPPPTGSVSEDPTAAPTLRNPCEGKRPDFPDIACIVDGIYTTGEQSGTNVTRGYQGSRITTAPLITDPFSEVGLCPVNVHWRLGAEHYSLGEYDETGTGPLDSHEGRHRKGFQCSFYDSTDAKFTEHYYWQHCINMTIGQTYEVQWPHSAAGLCNTPWQYQTPFLDGVFCKDDVITDSAAQIGVQSQVFTVVNDEEYYFPDLFTGMIVDADHGTDLAMYTGSTTGTARSNEICSPFTPITWQVDRKCHLISASSFDKMCADMKAQADNLSDDLYAPGSRELVNDEHAANNQH